MTRKAKGDKLSIMLGMFERYRKNLDDIERLQCDKCFASDSVRGSSTDLPYGAHTIRVAGVDRARAEYNKARIEIMRGEAACVDAALVLAPERVKSALTLRYLDGMPTWEAVADVMRGESPSLKADALKKAVYRYLSEC